LRVRESVKMIWIEREIRNEFFLGEEEKFFELQPNFNKKI
jgi:hypothetical protein